MTSQLHVPDTPGTHGNHGWCALLRNKGMATLKRADKEALEKVFKKVRARDVQFKHPAVAAQIEACMLLLP